MVCCSSGVQPRSSSPWLIISLNSWKRSFSCCCWMGDRCSGTVGEAVWRWLVEVESRRWQQPLGCLHSGQHVSGGALGGDYGSRPILWSRWRARGLQTQTPAELLLGRSKHLRWARGYGSGLVGLFRRGYRWLGASVRGWWEEGPVFGRR